MALAVIPIFLWIQAMIYVLNTGPDRTRELNGISDGHLTILGIAVY